MKVYNHKDAFEHLKYLFKFQKEDCFIAVFTESAVHYGDELWFNEDMAKELNLNTYNIQRKGGAIVASPGDVVYCFLFKDDDNTITKKLNEFLMRKIGLKNIDVQLDGNDLLVNGKKCFGCMKQTVGRMHFIGGHISIDCNLDLIKKVCTKHMKKEPGGLAEHQVTTNEVVEWLNEFWFRYKK